MKQGIVFWSCIMAFLACAMITSMIMLCIPLASATWYADLNPDLLHYYTFDEASGTLYDSIGALNVTGVHGTPVYSAPAKQGTGIMFNSNGDYFQEATGAGQLDFGTTQDFTINLWLYINVTNPTENHIFRNKDDWATYTLINNDHAGGIVLQSASSGGGTQVHPEFPDATWMMVTYIRNDSGTDYWVYINGIFNKTTVSAGQNIDANLIQFGDDRSDRYMNGTLDEFAIWNNSLNETQMLELYNGGAGITYGSIAPPNTAPNININNPANNSQFNNSESVPFYFTAIDYENATLNCTIFLDSLYNYSDDGVPNNSASVFVVDGINYGRHNWTINCSDGILTNQSALRFLMMNDTLTSPSISYNPSSTAAGFPGGNFIFTNVTCTDSTDSVYNATFDWNGANQTFTTVVPSYKYWINKTGLIDGVYAVSSYCNDTYGNVNRTDIRSITIDTIRPNITVYSPTNNTNYSSNSILINFSEADVNPNALWYYNGTDNYSYTAPVYITLEDGWHTLWFYADDVTGNLNYTMRRIGITSSVPGALNYTTNTLEGSNETFWIVVGYNNVTITNMTAVFYYNNTAYSPVKYTNNGTHYNFSKSILVPLINDSGKQHINNLLYFTFNSTDGITYSVSNSTLYNQTTHKMEVIDNSAALCSGKTNYRFTLADFEHYNEESGVQPVSAPTTTWGLIAWNPDSPQWTRYYPAVSYTTDTILCYHWADSSHPFMIKTNYSTAVTTNYTDRHNNFCLIPDGTNNTATTQYLLFSNSSYQKFYFNVKDISQNNLPNIYIKIDKTAVPSKFLSSIMTDAYGNSIERLLPEESYHLTLMDTNCTVLKTFDLILNCPSLPCQYNLLVSNLTNPYETIEELPDFAYSWSFEPTNKTLTLAYEDTAAQISSVYLYVYNKSINADDVITCTNASTASTNALTCNLSSYNSGTFIARMDANTMTKTFQRYYNFAINAAKDVFGKETLLWSALLLITLFFVGIWNPVVALTLLFLGLILVSVIGFVAIQWVAFIFIGVVIIIVIIKIRT